MASGEKDAIAGQHGLTKFDNIWYPNMMISNQETLSSIREAIVGDDDILVATYPKSGTAWMLRILSLIRNKADVDKTDAVPLAYATKMLELEHISGVMSDPEPRIIKSHMAYEHLPRSFREGNNKIIYVVRNPKDVSVSFYFHYKLMPWEHQRDETFDMFFERFIKGFVHFGTWSEHVKTFWAHRNDANVLWLTYEDLQQNTESRIADIAKFWNKELTEEQIKIIANESSFGTMKSKPSTNYAKYHNGGLMDESKTQYMRKGIVGDWKNHYTPEINQVMDDLLEKEMAPLGLKFRYE